MFGSLTFAMVVIAIYTAQFMLPHGNRTTQFGAFNLIALAALLPLKAVIAVSGYTLALWLVLGGLGKLQKQAVNQRWGIIRVAGWILGLAPVFAHEYLGESDSDIVSLMTLLGVSYFGLRVIDSFGAIADGRKLLDPLALLGYYLPFNMILSGPIGAYAEHTKLANATVEPPTFERFVDHCFTISLGLFFKFFVAEVYRTAVIGDTGDWPLDGPVDTWIFLVYIFFDFSGYSLIALGVGRLLGIPTPVNFDRPFLAVNFSDFWRRWHMTLGAFVSRNLYSPILLFLLRQTKAKATKTLALIDAFSLAVPFVFVGLWHHFTTGFLLWGIVVGMLVASERYIAGFPAVKAIVKRTSTQPEIAVPVRLIGIAYTQAMVAISLSIVIKQF